MQRRQFLTHATSAGVAAAAATPTGQAAFAGAMNARADTTVAPPRRRSAGGGLTVAFLIGPHVNVIDTAGPWEVFQDVMLGDDDEGHRHGFSLFTVSERADPLEATGGLTLVPDFTFGRAPEPKVIVIPAQRTSPTAIEWVRAASRKADLVFSVCTGAFPLARTGLLDGQTATTHHEFYDDFEREFPRVKLERSVRFVEHKRVATAGGLTSGIDLALRVVERYYGRARAKATATYMEYESQRWMS